jgi:ribulose-phosphate 3-epimerase
MFLAEGSSIHAAHGVRLRASPLEPTELIRQKLVEPSILSADYARLGEEIRAVMDVGARAIHVDVMDGHFVPPITIGTVIVEAIRDQVHEAGGMLDCHLMIEHPERQVAEFAKAGADSITIQLEATPNVHYVLMKIREEGCLAGLAINPGTPPAAVSELVEVVDLVLCMTVNPGWGGQDFIERSPEKVRELRKVLGPDVPIQVDGGISHETGPLVKREGASLFVAGSQIFHAKDPAAAYREIAEAVGAAEDG